MESVQSDSIYELIKKSRDFNYRLESETTRIEAIEAFDELMKEAEVVQKKSSVYENESFQTSKMILAAFLSDLRQTDPNV